MIRSKQCGIFLALLLSVFGKDIWACDHAKTPRAFNADKTRVEKVFQILNPHLKKLKELEDAMHKALWASRDKGKGQRKEKEELAEWAALKEWENKQPISIHESRFLCGYDILPCGHDVNKGGSDTIVNKKLKEKLRVDLAQMHYLMEHKQAPQDLIEKLERLLEINGTEDGQSPPARPDQAAEKVIPAPENITWD